MHYFKLFLRLNLEIVKFPGIKVIAQGKQIDLVFMIMNHEGQIKSEFLRDSKGITQN